LRSKRAISPIIATVLLIAITIAAGLAIYGWVSGLMSAGTSSKLTGTTSLTLSVQGIGLKQGPVGSNVVNISVTNEGSYNVVLTANQGSTSQLLVVASDGDIVNGDFGFGDGIQSGDTGSSWTWTIPAGGTVTIVLTTSMPTPATYTLKIVNAQDVQGNTVVSNSVSFTVPSPP